MGRKNFLFIIFLIFFICITNLSYCAENYPTITLEQSEAIFNFILNIQKNSSPAIKNNVSTSTPISFQKYFNEKVAPSISNLTSGECDSSKHFILFCYENYLLFLTTNATLSNNLKFLSIETASDGFMYKIYYEYAFFISFNGNNSFSYNGYIRDDWTRGDLFYSGDTASNFPFTDNTDSILTTPNLYYLGNRALSDVKFRPYNSNTFSWYFLEYCFGSDVPPSGDTPSGDTPSGDIPNYNDKLDNISGLISDNNNNLVIISGEIGQTNNKLDGISGELGEINDNLTTVPDLSGTTINSGDIESALNFDFAEDPYSNFWLELNTGLSSALTGNNRTITISFRNKNYIISLDDFSLQIPEFLKSFLAIISTSLVVWQIVRYIKIIVDKISSGDMDSVLAMNEEERNS